MGRSHNPGVFYNPRVVTDGLVLALDAGNSKSSYKTDNNLLDLSGWAVGATSVSGFTFNGLASENALILDTDPFGNEAVIWKAYNRSSTGIDGGFVGGYITIDRTKLYRFSVWVNREVIATSGKTLFQVSHSTSSGTPTPSTLSNITDRSTGNSTSTFFESSEPVTEIPQNEWVLLVAHIWPSGSGTGDDKSDTGIYKTNSDKLDVTVNDLVWNGASLQAGTYIQIYNDTTQAPAEDSSAVQLHVYPRIDLVDGTEPSIDDLLHNRVNSLYWYDSSNVHGDLNLLDGPTFDSANGGSLVFDGVNDRAVNSSIPVIYGNNNTWEAWVYCTDSGTEMFMGRYYPRFYFSAGNTIKIENQFTSNSTVYTLQTPSNLSLNTWYHAVFTTTYITGSNRTQMRIYINGTQVSAGLAYPGAQRNFVASISQFVVGGGFYNYGSPFGPFKGKIANVKVYNRTLSASEVQQNFNSLKGRFGL